MENWRGQRCTGCKFLEVQEEFDGPGILWCRNSTTKELDHPIGFLDARAPACQYFKGIIEKEEAATGALKCKQMQPEPLGRKVGWWFGLTQVGFWVCIFLTICGHQYDAAFRMLALLAALLAINLVREVSADLLTGKIKLSR
jgi:hypothetical protein